MTISLHASGSGTNEGTIESAPGLSPYQRGSTFVSPSGSSWLSNYRLYTRQHAGSGGTVYAELSSSLGGPVLATSTSTPFSSVPTSSYDWVNFDFAAADYQLTPSTRYFVSIKFSEATTALKSQYEFSGLQDLNQFYYVVSNPAVFEYDTNEIRAELYLSDVSLAAPPPPANVLTPTSQSVAVRGMVDITLDEASLVSLSGVSTANWKKVLAIYTSAGKKSVVVSYKPTTRTVARFRASSALSATYSLSKIVIIRQDNSQVAVERSSLTNPSEMDITTT